MITMTKSEVGMRHRTSFALFLVAAMCFLLPFFTFSCEGTKIASVNGVNLAFGGSITLRDPFSGETEEKPVAKHTAAIVAGACAIAGALTALSSGMGIIVPVFIAFSGFGALIWLRHDIVAETIREAEGLMKVNAGVGFILAMFAFLTVAAINLFVAFDGPARLKAWLSDAIRDAGDGPSPGGSG